VAALIKKDLGLDPQVVAGDRGEFTVWVGETVVARKDSGVFPEDDDVLTAVRQAVGRD
jgi:hypothetical protein